MIVTLEEAKHILWILYRHETSPKLRQTYQIAMDLIDKAIGKKLIKIHGTKRCTCRAFVNPLWEYCPMCGQKIQKGE